MLTSRYMPAVNKVPLIMRAIQDGAAPPKFTAQHLKTIGFPSSNDRSIIPVLKDLKFLTGDGVPTQRYHDYRDRSRSRAVLGEALRETYQDLFHINERPTEQNKTAIEGKFKAVHNVEDNIAELQARTFFAFLKLADLDAGTSGKRDATKPADTSADVDQGSSTKQERDSFSAVGLRYNIEVHLPATKDVEVYNAIFKSLKEHLVDH